MIALLLGGDLHVAPDGRPGNPGTPEAPLDLRSTLDGTARVAPGTTIWLRGGTYDGKIQIRLAGTADAPVVVRGKPGERATIADGRLDVVAPSTHVWFRDFEIAGTVPREKRVTDQKGSWPTDLPGGDGINIRHGEIRLLNLVIRDNAGNGIGWWSTAAGGEVHGCLVYGNGWKGPDRGHGHCLYTQNREGLKRITGNVFVAGFDGSYTLHAYGSSKAWVDHYLVEENIAFENGPFLLGGGRPSRGLIVRRNALHRVGLQLGYSAPHNEDCEVRDNVAPHGLSIKKFASAVDEGNVRAMPDGRALLFRNGVEPGRAHLAVYNGAKRPSQPVPVEGFLAPGERFRLLDARDVHGAPVLEGACAGAAIEVPMKGEFAAFVLLKEAAK